MTSFRFGIKTSTAGAAGGDKAKGGAAGWFSGLLACLHLRNNKVVPSGKRQLERSKVVAVSTGQPQRPLLSLAGPTTRCGTILLAARPACAPVSAGRHVNVPVCRFRLVSKLPPCCSGFQPKYLRFTRAIVYLLPACLPDRPLAGAAAYCC